MAISGNPADDFGRLKVPAGKLNKALEEECLDPQDAVFVLAMVAAFIINTHRQDGVELKTAQDAFCNLVRGLSELGEHDDEAENELVEKQS